MAIAKIQGSQRDFSAGELDVAMKRADENPIMKAGLRQASNGRILNSKAIQNRPGRRALFREAGRVEEVLIASGSAFYLVFGNGYLRVYDSTGTQVFTSSLMGDGVTAIPWTTATLSGIVWTSVWLSIYIAFSQQNIFANVPQVLTWDGASTWTLATYAEAISGGGQKRTLFYRISPPNITLLPSATTGIVNITFSDNVLVAGSIGTRLRFCGRQLQIKTVTNGKTGTATVIEPLPPGQQLTLSATVGNFNVGDELKGGTSGAIGIVTVAPTTQIISFTGAPAGTFLVGDAITGGTSGATGVITSVPDAPPHLIGSIVVQLSTGTAFQAAEVITGPHGSASSTAVTGAVLIVQLLQSGTGIVDVFNNSEIVVGPSGSATTSAVATKIPQAVAVWDDEVMNTLRGYPKSVFFDQNRLGFCNFPSVPSAIAWSAIGTPTDLYVDALPDNAIFELAPGKVQVLFVVPGMEGSEFAFHDSAIDYIPITATNPLKPGSVAFNRISQQGIQPHVQPRTAEQTIVYVKSGGTAIGAVQAPGSYYRPYVVDEISELHGHLLNSPIAIAIPTGSAQFEEDYIYVLNTDGTLVVGKYSMKNGLLDAGPDGSPHIGWVPWSGAGSVQWVSGFGSDAIFTTAYGAVSVVEVLDNTQYLDGALLVNSLPAPFVTGGKGPLYAFPGPGATVTLLDQGYRMMGTYTTDANGNIIPQNNGGENLLAATLVAGQPWTATFEPFVPDAPPGGQDVHQRMMPRRVARFAVYVSQSTGFVIGRLFSGKLRPGGPALGTLMNFRRIPAWNQDDDATKPPPLREQAERARPLGRSYDPRIAIIKDTPGPIVIHEIAQEATI